MSFVDEWQQKGEDIIARLQEHDGDPEVAFPAHPWPVLIKTAHRVLRECSRMQSVDARLRGPMLPVAMIPAANALLVWYLIGYELGRQRGQEGTP